MPAGDCLTGPLAMRTCCGGCSRGVQCLTRPHVPPAPSPTHPHHRQVRQRALLALSEGLGPRGPAGQSADLPWLQRLLALDTPEQAAQLCRIHGFEVAAGGEGAPAAALLARGAFREAEAPLARHRAAFITAKAPARRSQAVTTPSVAPLSQAEMATAEAARLAALAAQSAAAQRAAAAAAADQQRRDEAAAAAAAEAERWRQQQEEAQR